ncbi:hypothetical protein Adt_33592 [Abeliophyllum distichum]|uniref:Uncharacterized protein n=1 Tax=Abeliophyllum distichum TaxID=126358 RepID=A0ABD1QZ90_9LAMI
MLDWTKDKIVKVRDTARKSTALPHHLRPKALAKQAYENFDLDFSLSRHIEKFLLLRRKVTSYRNRIGNAEAIDHIFRTFTPLGVQRGSIIKKEMLEENPNHIDVKTFC